MTAPPTDEFGQVRIGQDEAEESYFASMTDIMVGLLFIFIIMLMAFGLMLKAAAERTEQTREDVRDIVRESRDDVQQMRDLDQLRAQMLQDIQQRLRERGIQVIVREENGVLQLPDEILFDKGDDVLSPVGLGAINHLAAALDVVLPCYAVVPVGAKAPDCGVVVSNQLRLEAVFVEGHTDSDGSHDYNWTLSASRAINTYRALAERAPITTALLNDQGQYLFSVAGYGKNRPVVDEVTDDDKRQNRRIDLRFVMHVSHAEALEQVQNRLERVLGAP